MDVSLLAGLLICAPFYLLAGLLVCDGAQVLFRAAGRFYRFAWHQVVIRRAMFGFDRNARKLLSVHSGKRGNVYPPSYNDPDSP